MDCAYCKDTLLEGAVNCRSCGRRQPRGPRGDNEWDPFSIAITVAALLVIVVPFVWIFARSQAKEEAMTKAVNGAITCGRGNMVSEYDLERYHDSGYSWDEAARLEVIATCPFNYSRDDIDGKLLRRLNK